MKQYRKLPKVHWFFVGLVVLGMLLACGGSQPSYSAPHDSYDSLPQQDSYDNSPQQDTSEGNPASLVGHWRYTDILDSSIPLIIDYNVYFYANGTFESDEVNESGEHSNYISGTWTATDTTITLNLSNGESGQIGYTLSGGVLVFDGNSKYFERVNP